MTERRTLTAQAECSDNPRNPGQHEPNQTHRQAHEGRSLDGCNFVFCIWCGAIQDEDSEEWLP